MNVKDDAKTRDDSDAPLDFSLVLQLSLCYTKDQPLKIKGKQQVQALGPASMRTIYRTPSRSLDQATSTLPRKQTIRLRMNASSKKPSSLPSNH